MKNYYYGKKVEGNSAHLKGKRKGKRTGVQESQESQKSAPSRTASSGVNVPVFLPVFDSCHNVNKSYMCTTQTHHIRIYTQRRTYTYVDMCMELFITNAFHKHSLSEVTDRHLNSTKFNTTAGSRNTAVNRTDRTSAPGECPPILRILGYSVRC